ncbi:hypothetical protein DPX39_090017300 [Trypanosoma brucei equiperdum]|uniref:Uncharacterized protein n=1 Tax=Trypanosoma brucei equiperdum TaxID=630700 RepID=A0A3L6L069_9TRYP|nr:hypothetical protein DPX39_090017300 [Trypanosoma brucei equiperdum]
MQKKPFVCQYIENSSISHSPTSNKCKGSPLKGNDPEQNIENTCFNVPRQQGGVIKVKQKMRICGDATISSTEYKVTTVNKRFSPIPLPKL